MIGIGMDAVTEQLLRSIRLDVPHGGRSWDNYWEIVQLTQPPPTGPA